MHCRYCWLMIEKGSKCHNLQKIIGSLQSVIYPHSNYHQNVKDDWKTNKLKIATTNQALTFYKQCKPSFLVWFLREYKKGNIYIYIYMTSSLVLNKKLSFYIQHNTWCKSFFLIIIIFLIIKFAKIFSGSNKE